MLHKAPRLTLVFDGYCGFCTRSVGWIRRLDRSDRIELLPYQAAGVPEAHGLSHADCEAAVWALGPGSERHRGAAAVNAALAAALGVRLPMALYRLSVVGWLQDAVYAWVARNRRRLPGVTPWCISHPEAGCAEGAGSCAPR
jgi:predicted DCC family thiol-disulfide oxidoreductase YuxK